MTPKEHEVSLLDLAKKLGAKVKEITEPRERRFQQGDIVYVTKEDALSSGLKKGEELQILSLFQQTSYETMSTETGKVRVMMDEYLSATREEAMR